MVRPKQEETGSAQPSWTARAKAGLPAAPGLSLFTVPRDLQKASPTPGPLAWKQTAAAGAALVLVSRLRQTHPNCFQVLGQ